MLILDQQYYKPELWTAAGFFRLFSCIQDDTLDEYRKYSDSLIGTRPFYFEPTYTNDRCGVYILYFKRRGKFYIGSSRTLRDRVGVHLSFLKSKKHYNPKIQQAYDDGDRLPEVFYIFTKGEDQARQAEQRLIDLVFLDACCLNKRQMVEEYRPATDDTRKNLSDSAKRQWTQEFREKIQAINKKPENLARRIAIGKKLTQNPAYMQKLSDASKKLWEDPAYIEKQKQSGADVWKTEGFRERHTEAMKAKWADPEYKKRVIEKSVSKRRVPITFEGKTYSHVGEASKSLGIPETSLRRKLRSAS